MIFYYLFSKSIMGFIIGQAIGGVILIIIIPAVLNLS